MINKAIKYSTTQFKYTSLTLLDNRCILQLNGADCYSLLQGITTNDLKFSSNKQCIYTNFLNTQGRILSDAFVIRPEQYQISKLGLLKNNGNSSKMNCGQILIMTLRNSSQERKSKQLISVLKQRCSHYTQFLENQKSDLMRHKEELGDQIPQFEQSLEIEEGTYRNMCFSDPRKDQMGCRLITNDPEVQMDETMIKRTGEHVYEAYRLRQGILEGQELENKLPFSCNMDFYNAICMSKGCYVGQELVSRSYHTGVIRKRIMPFVIIENNIEGAFTELEFNYPDISGIEITNKEQSFGKIIKNCGNFGVAEVRYLEMDLSQRFQAGNHTIEFCIDPYLSHRIDSYKELLQNR